MMFATQSLDTVPPDFLKWFLVVGIALIGVATAVIVAVAAIRKRSVNIEPQPMEVRKQPKRYNHDLAEERYAVTTARLDSHDEEIKRLWETTTSEQSKIREEVQVNRAHNEQLMAEQTKEIHEMENRIRDKIDNLPARIIADVRNLFSKS